MREDSSEKLAQQTREVSSALVNASTAAKETLSKRCSELSSQIDHTMKSFTARLEDKVKTGTTLKSMLEKEKSIIFGDIHNELVEAREQFEIRLSTMVRNAVNKIDSVAGEIENKIRTIKIQCEDQLKNDTGHARNEVETAIANFLSQIAERQRIALEEISKAAGLDATNDDKPQLSNTKNKRNRKTKESNIPPES